MVVGGVEKLALAALRGDGPVDLDVLAREATRLHAIGMLSDRLRNREPKERDRRSDHGDAHRTLAPAPHVRARSSRRTSYGDPSIVGLAQARTDTVARIYHKGHEQAWDGRAVLDELVAKHGGIHFPDDKREAFSAVASVLLWGELAAWSISADLALKLEDTPAKMAASSQVFDEARHFYVLRDYLWRAGLPVSKLGGWSRRLLVELLETENLLYKVVGMQLLVESTAVVMFRKIAEAKIEPVLTELLYYFERDEARHVGLGVLTLPDGARGAVGPRRARAVVVPDQDAARDDRRRAHDQPGVRRRSASIRPR